VLILTLITRVAYPLLVIGIAKVAFAVKANASLIVKDGKVVGSRLLGQPFESPKHFWLFVGSGAERSGGRG